PDVLVRVRAAQLTVMSVFVPELPEKPFVESKVAWLDRVPQVAASVRLVMWTWTESPLASTAGPQLRAWAVLSTEQFEAVVLAASTIQSWPVMGSGSSPMVTPWATPAPVLVTVMV